MAEKQTNHSHSMEHEDLQNLGTGRLLLVIVFNLVISAAEIIGGLVSGSLALISDAMHNTSDILSTAFSYVTLRISQKPRNKSKTYGYGRANILAAFVNAAVLIAIGVYLIVEAVRRFYNPPEVAGNLVIIIAAVALAGDLLSVLVLRSRAGGSMNVKSTYLHHISDMLASVAVIVSGIIIRLTDAAWVDPVFSILINLIILQSAYRLLRESIGILMQSAPATADIDRIIKKLREIDGVVGAHHLHV